MYLHIQAHTFKLKQNSVKEKRESQQIKLLQNDSQTISLPTQRQL